MSKIRIYQIFSVGLLLIALSSCSGISKMPVYYMPAITSSHVSYMPKPMISDSVKTKNYISGSFCNNTMPFETGNMNMGFLDYNRSHIIKKINFSYGGFAYFGGTSKGVEDEKRVVKEEFNHKGFHGFGLRTSIGVAETSGNVEIRLFNWENSLVFEGGNYSTFMKEVRTENDPLSIASDKTTLFTTGGSTEIIWHSKTNRDRQYSFRLFIGTTIGLEDNINYTNETISGLATDFAFFFKIKNAFGVLSTGNNLKNDSGKITLGYSF